MSDPEEPFETPPPADSEPTLNGPVEVPRDAGPHFEHGPIFVKDPPFWSYLLTPAALVLGSVLISATIWYTREDDAGPASDSVAVVGAVSTVASEAPVASSAAGLLDTMKGYARQLGLDETRFGQCVTNQQNLAPLTRDLEAGRALGVTGTPTFFINNKKLVGAQPLSLFEEIIEAEIKGSPTTIDGYSPALKQLAATNPPNFAIMPSGPDISAAAIQGSANAKVVIAEFSDFQCPFCKQWGDRTLAQLRTRLGKDVALAFVHYPLVQIHPNAGNASLVAICAGQQNKFWEMHDLLFARQAEWSNLK